MRKVTVRIMPRKSILDPQGQAIEQALHNMGFKAVEGVRQGKIIEMTVPEDLPETQLQEMCDKLLANPMMEDYEIDMAG